MVVGVRKYGLQWQMNVGETWHVLYHGNEADWCHLTREDMLAIWAMEGDVAKINEFAARHISKERYCEVVIGKKISEIVV